MAGRNLGGRLHPRVTIGMSFLPKVEQLDKMVTEKAGFKR